jgi:hypothetical protein
VLHRLPPPPPVLASVTPPIASQTVQRLISTQLQDTGFDSVQPLAMRRLETEVAACEFVASRVLRGLIALRVV